MTGLYPDKYILPTTTFTEPCVFTALGSNTTSIGGLGTGLLDLGAAGKNTQIRGDLIRPATNVDRLTANRITSAQALSTLNTDITLVWNQLLEQVGTISVNTTTGVITIPKAGFYHVAATANIQSGATNNYVAIGFTSPATTSNSFATVVFQATANRPASVSFSDIIYFNAATTLRITARVTASANFLNLVTSGSYSTNRLVITRLF